MSVLNEETMISLRNFFDMNIIGAKDALGEFCYLLN